MPSRVHVRPRMRGPAGSSTSFWKGVAASGVTIQIDAAVFEFWLTTAKRRPSEDQAGIPFENPELMSGAGASVVYCGCPSEFTNDSLVYPGPVVAGSM